MLSAVLKANHPFFLRKNAPEMLSSGMAEVDRIAGGFPRGALTEICGAACSGRTSLLLSALAVATSGAEICAIVDACDTFHPASAATAGVDLDHLIWVRCGGNAEHALKCADLLVQAGGFGLIALDLADVRQNVGIPEILDTHRPDAFQLKAVHLKEGHGVSHCAAPATLALRAYRPPRPLDLARFRRKLAAIAGPWRTSGEWWSATPWDRDEYDAALLDGTLYRIFQDRGTRLWFFEGSYD